MRTTVAIRSLLFSFFLLIFSQSAFAQISVGISVNFGPPAIPVYEQPICPTDGYLWPSENQATDRAGNDLIVASLSVIFRRSIQRGHSSRLATTLVMPGEE